MTRFRAFESSVAVVILLSAAVPIVSAEETMRICLVFKDLRSHRGQILAVRGAFSPGMGTIIDPACRNRLESRGRAWPVAIHLVYVGDNPTGDLVPDFEPDSDSLQEFRKALDRIRGRKDVEIVGTFVGLLRTKTDLSPMIGYGHLNSFPAELVLKSVRDLVVGVTFFL